MSEDLRSEEGVLMAARAFLGELLARRLSTSGAAWLREAQAEVAADPPEPRFAALLSLASRHCRGGALAPTRAELESAAEVLPGWSPEWWTQLDAARVALVLARTDLAEESGARAIEDAFRHADMGELGALYRSLPFLPAGERFRWRAGEGCRSNMTAVFVSIACDQPYPLRHFDDLVWNQMVVKALFVNAPLWRVHGLDQRLGEELARMALDLCDERRSAGRPVQHELWLCLGTYGGERARAALEAELDPANPAPLGRRAAAYGMARAGHRQRLAELAARETDPAVAAAMAAALSGDTSQEAFRSLDPRPAAP